MRPLVVMTLADLRQRVRDRTVVIFGLIVPLGLIVVFHAVAGGAIDARLQPVTVAASVPEHDRLAATIVEVVRSLEAPDVTVREMTARQARQAAADGKADAALVVPAGFTRAIERSDPVSVPVVDATSGLEMRIVETVVDSTLQQMHAAAVAARAAGVSGFDQKQIEQVVRRVTSDAAELTISEGRAADEQLPAAGSLVAGQAGMFLLFTVGFGVLALLAEREQGTLARLYSMPLRRGLVMAAKGASGFLLGVVATGVLLTAGSLLFDVGFGDPLAVAVLVVCAVAAATSLTFVVARVAQTAEQANFAQSVLAMLLGVAGGAFFPFSARGLFGQLLDLNPVAAFQRGLGITAGGGGLTDLGTPVATMVGFAAVMVLVSRLVPDRGTHR